MKTVSVMEGDSVTLHTDTDTQRNNAVIEWMFGAENPDTVIAEINRSANISHITDERFRDRVKMDSQTGSLTITNIRTTDSGLYKVEITTNKSAAKTFNVTVYALLPVPVIIRDTSQCSSSSGSSSVSKCSVLCSVLNVSHVTLSWYKGNSLISNISASDLSISLSLPLEVEHQDKNTYSCVLNNNISNQTKHLNISQLCQPCAALLPVPVIIRDTSQCSSSSGSSSVSKCSLLCSVLNVNHVTLSWNKGNSLISSISASDLSISLSLPLEVEHQDKNTYSCVLNNNISNQTKHMNISQLCQPCADFIPIQTVTLVFGLISVVLVFGMF
ncbi:CD48 antigen-like, partial [Sinocyclocheilus grahami]|uniref:CD48 antigen-like n=1 Tax=Sinocyclocheilus grahami TaxID=75366 RepID=UPI0007ACB112